MSSSPASLPSSAEDSTLQRAEVLRREYQTRLWKNTDRMFAVLLLLQWIAAIAIAIWISPWSWEGLERHVNPHIWWAVGIGGLIAALPIYLAIVQPGDTSTRMVIAVAQMLHSALLIHLSGGRIETHFHIFGSLAFLSFYRDWRVLVPATLVVVADHAIRGIFWPESVFGVLSVSPWRSVEHAGWVAFEDVFLVWSCLRGARELVLLASRQAQLESINHLVEQEVARKTLQLESVTQELVATARRAGMAEVATGVLHNVGNVLNSVNVSAHVICETVKQSAVPKLCKATEMIDSHQDQLASFLTTDERGRQIPRYISAVSRTLLQENATLTTEASNLSRGIEHIKQIIDSQQQCAKISTIRTLVDPALVIEDAVRINIASLERHGIRIAREVSWLEVAELDTHKTLQILVNLIANAKNALKDAAGTVSPTITLRLVLADVEGTRSLRYEVVDNGVGISQEHLSRLFRHGFTTRAGGHGFGLHSAANAAREMGGSLTACSEGPGRGARFTLDIPLASATAKAA